MVVGITKNGRWRDTASPVGFGMMGTVLELDKDNGYPSLETRYNKSCWIAHFKTVLHNINSASKN